MGTDTLTYSVSHRTVLRYTAKVSLSYNEVRMRPRDRGSQRTLAFSLLEQTLGGAAQPGRLLRQLRPPPRRHDTA